MLSFLCTVWTDLSTTASASGLVLPLSTLALCLYLGFRALLASPGEVRDAQGVVAQRPPRVSSWLPWLGSAIPFGRDADAFLFACRARLGPVFQLQLAGSRLIYVTSSSGIASVYKLTKLLKFSEIRKEMAFTVFGCTSFDEFGDSEIFPLHHKLISNANLVETTRVLVRRVEKEMKALVGHQGDQVSISLEALAIKSLYNGSSEAFFGPSFPSDEIWPHYLLFDAAFPLVAAEMPAWLPPVRKAIRARDAAVRILSDWIPASDHSEMSPLIRGILAWAQSHDLSLKEQASFIFSDLWALQANASMAGFWVLGYILTTPHLLEELREELSNVYGTWGGSARGTVADMLCEDGFATLDGAGKGDGLALLGSVIKESLRMSSSVFSIRRVAEDCVVSADEGSWGFEKGERLICATRTLHMDDAHYEHASSFAPRRFLDTKAGQGGNFLPFGGGVSLCEGRVFAIRELTAFAALALHHLDIELVPGETLPEIDLSRSGGGILHPKQDLALQVKLRSA